MLESYCRHRAVFPFYALVVALVCGSCSDDRRAILAPGDASLALSTSGLIIANQAVDLTVSATKSDGSPVADGTEIQLTASVGEIEATKVRTQGGQATTTYQAAGVGPIEFVASSSDARGELTVNALSAQPVRVAVTSSADSVPEGGGEVEVVATVFGPSNEPVAGAPIEFFASNGSFAPAGPFLTDANGKATTKLATAQVTQVRARVLTLESGLLEIKVRPPLGKNDQADLPFRMSELVFLHAPEAVDWDVTSTITEVTFQTSGSHVTDICFPHTKAGRWKRSGAGEGNVWVIAQVNGTWYAATWDYIRPGQVCKSASGFTWDDRRDGIGAHTKQSPLNTWRPDHGERIGIMVSGFARTSQRTVLERSNIFMTDWP